MILLLRRHNARFLWLLSATHWAASRSFYSQAFMTGRPGIFNNNNYIPFQHVPFKSAMFFASSTSSLPDLESMRISEIKNELESYGINTKQYLEKTELLTALKDARAKGLEPKNKSTSSTSTTTSSSSSTSTASDNQSTSSSSSSASTSTGSSSSSSNNSNNRQEQLAKEMEVCAKMKPSDLKKELQDRGISTTSFFEKSEFVKALAQARVDNVNKKSNSNNNSNSNNSNGEKYAEYKDVEVLTDDSAGPRVKDSTTSESSSSSPFGSASAGSSPFGGSAGSSMFGNMGGIADMFKNLGGMGGAADMLKNLGNMGGGTGANPFGGGGANPFGGGGGMGDMMGKAQQMMQNPKVREIVAKAQSNPRIMSKVQECMSNPASFAKYQNDPDVRELVDEIRKYM